MTLVLTLVGCEAGLAQFAADTVAALARHGAEPGPVDWLAADVACDIPMGAGDPESAEAAARAVVDGAPVDLAVQPREGRRKRLLLADMDSTVVTGETLDELAALAGVADRVVPVTRRAMNGEIGFAEAVRQRVALLEGKPAALIDGVLADTRLTDGARALARTMRAHGAYCLLISGGFRVFADRVAEWAGFDAAEANHLLVEGDRLAGRVAEPILGKERKLEALQQAAAARGIAMDETLAVGDGANDLPMLLAAGLGVAFRAKPSVRALARARLDHADLTGLLYFQGYREAEIVRD
jgi:phosphoserine phosphatase